MQTISPEPTNRVPSHLMEGIATKGAVCELDRKCYGLNKKKTHTIITCYCLDLPKMIERDRVEYHAHMNK